MITLAAETNPLVPPLGELVIGLICFLGLFAVLAKFAFPNINRTLAERTDKIEGGLERAAQAQAEAGELLEQYRAQLSEARLEAARLREEGREQGSAIIAELREQALHEARRITAAAQAQLDAEREQAIATLRAEVGDLSLRLAERIVGESVTDEARQSRIIDRFLDELEVERL
ncbi:MAG: F0F1 ATP synthase subunit B [Actinomycetes bacterium]